LVIVQNNLLHLYFNNDGLQAEAVTALTALIMENYAQQSGDAARTTQLRTFEIASNCLEDAGFLALIPLVQASPLLNTLRIATTRVRNNKGAGLAMARTLLGLHHLTSLSLNDNNLGAEAGIELAQVIRNNSQHLKFLNLGDIGVEEKGVEAILNSLASIKPGVLTHLDLSANELTSKSASKLVRVVRSQSASLEHLKLEDNELRSSGASKLFSALSSCKKLTYLNLTNNHLGDRCSNALLSFIADSPQLKELHINGNRFTESTLDRIKETVAAAAGSEAPLATMSDNDADEEESEEDAEEDASEEEPEEEAASAAAAAAAASVSVGKPAEADIDALTAGLAATSVSK
jgi:Ran GTPase-activating protein (RanGAP) involved in mRNA processing and transport